MSVQVKICGVTRVEDALAAVAMGAEMIGLNFYPPSPRCISVERGREISNALDGRARLVGVFVNAEREYVAERMMEASLDLIQFHGDEDEAAVSGWPVPVIRALRLRPDEPLDRVQEARAGYVLIDSFDPHLYGGTGKAQALARLQGLDLNRVFISGGLTPDNVAQAAALHPFAVDVASGVESAPGVKDHTKLRNFIVNAKSAR